MLRLSAKQKKFEYIKHPADIAFRVYGKTLPELFLNAVLALYDILKPHKKPESQIIEKNLTLSSSTIEELLVLFLNEILFFTTREYLIFNDFLINIKCLKKEKRLSCNMKGCIFDTLEREVKAVTYHKLKIRKANNYFFTEIVVDI